MRACSGSPLTARGAERRRPLTGHQPRARGAPGKRTEVVPERSARRAHGTGDREGSAHGQAGPPRPALGAREELRTRAHGHACMHTDAHAHGHMDAHEHTRTRTRGCTQTHMYMNTCTHANTCAHDTQMHTDTYAMDMQTHGAHASTARTHTHRHSAVRTCVCTRLPCSNRRGNGWEDMLSLGLERLSRAGRPRALGCWPPWGGLLILGGQRGAGWQRVCRAGSAVDRGQACRGARGPPRHWGPKAALGCDPARTGLFQASSCVLHEAGLKFVFS